MARQCPDLDAAALSLSGAWAAAADATLTPLAGGRGGSLSQEWKEHGNYVCIYIYTHTI